MRRQLDRVASVERTCCLVVGSCNGVTGFLVEEGDIEGMAGHMVRLATDDTLVKNMGSKAAEKIGRSFLLDPYLEKLWKLIENAVIQKS